MPDQYSTPVAAGTGHALDHDRLAARARSGIDTAMDLLARHEVSNGICSCGRPDPCPQRQSLTATLDHHRGTLALLEKTLVLPVLPAASTEVAGRRWRPISGLRNRLRPSPARVQP